MIIYAITNLINNKIYIGQTIRNLNQRINNHKSSSVNSKYPVHHAIKKYGWENFKVEIIENNIVTQEDLNNAEIFWINWYDSIENGYNLKAGGSNGKYSIESRQKISKSRQGKFLSNDTKEKCSKSQIERYKNPKEIEKLSLIQRKRYEDPKEIEKLSLIQRKRYEDPKEREKLSVAQIKRYKNQEEKEKTSLALKKYFQNIDNRRKRATQIKMIPKQYGFVLNEFELLNKENTKTYSYKIIAEKYKMKWTSVKLLICGIRESNKIESSIKDLILKEYQSLININNKRNIIKLLSKKYKIAHYTLRVIINIFESDLTSSTDNSASNL